MAGADGRTKVKEEEEEEEENGGDDGSSLARNDVLGDAQNVQGGSESDRRRGLEKSFQKPSFFPSSTLCRLWKPPKEEEEEEEEVEELSPNWRRREIRNHQISILMNSTRSGRLQFKQPEIKYSN